MEITIKIKLKECPQCLGKGKIEDCEYTPPFERFERTCPKCNGLGKIQE